MLRHRPPRVGYCSLVLFTVLGVAAGPECAAQITLDGSLGPRQALAGPNFAIDSSQGQIRGANLFHSFGQFNVRQGESARFTNSLQSSIANILGRVTGGERSFVDGLVRSDIAGANLYLFNPSGVAFGPNATLNVSGAFHVSTADYLRLADGGVFHANLQNASNLTIAPPAAFGFLSQTPAAISFDRTVLETPQGTTLSVIGGDVQIEGSTLRARNGLIQIASAASPGEAVPSMANGIADLRMSSFARLGQIQLSGEANATTSSPAGAGTVLIRGGRLVLDNAFINSNTTGAGDGAAIGVDVRVTGDAVLTNGAQIFHYSFGAGRAGDAHVTVGGKLQIKNGATIEGGASETGPAGNAFINAGVLEVLDGAGIVESTQGPNKGANLDVTAGSIVIADAVGFSGTGLFTGQFSFAGTGPGGSLTVNAGSIDISGSDNPNLGSGILGNTYGPGAGGPVRVTANSLKLGSNGSISNATFGPGQGGTLTIHVDGNISITGSTNPNIFTGLFANTFGTGHGGSLEIVSKSLQLAQRGSIQAGTFWTGDAGGATVKTGRLEIASGGGIFTSALFGAGNAGQITVTADSLLITGIRDSLEPMTNTTQFTGLSTSTGTFGKRGGDLSVVADSVVITDKGSISSVSVGAGDAGTIRITAGNLLVNERAAINASAVGSGRGGDIIVQANNVTVSGAGAPLGPFDPMISAIGSQSQGGTGAAGDVTITAKSLQVLDGAKLSTQTFGPGKGGNLSVQSDSVLVSGINSALAGHLNSIGDDPAGARAAIAASSERLLLGDRATGNAGNIRVLGGHVQVDAGGAITSRTSTPGRGGTIEVMADRVTLANNALISAESVTSPMAGKAGDIFINAKDSVQIGASAVTTAADRAEGGAINISANRIQLDPGTLLSAQASGAGNAGNITLVAGDSLVAVNSEISTEATQADGGNITLMAPTLVHLIGSKVTTSVGTGQGKGGNITIDPLFVILDGSELRADAFGGPGGNIRIAADVFLVQNSTLSASSALSTPGTIDIEARITDMSGNVARLPEGVAPVSALLRASCATRLAGGSISSLVLAGREGLPPDPEGLLPSPLLTAEIPAHRAHANSAANSAGEAHKPVVIAWQPLCSGFRVR